MSAQGTVYDLGYTPHHGPRLGRSAAVRAMFVDGVRKSLGLRRKHWSKVLPWLLVGAAIVPAAWVVALTFLFSGFNVDDTGPFRSPAEFFDMIGMLVLLFVALITPTLLIPDRKFGVLSVYASRPIHAADYLVARAGTIVLLAFLFILIPQAILYFGSSALYVDGVWAGLAHNAEEIPEILGTTAAYVVGYAAPAFLVSLYLQRVAFATGIYIAAMGMTAGLVEAMPLVTDSGDAGSRDARVLVSSGYYLDRHPYELSRASTLKLWRGHDVDVDRRAV